MGAVHGHPVGKRFPKVREDGKIICAGCKQYLPKRAYGKFTKAPPARCKKCHSEYHHAYRIKKEYGLTPEQYQEIFKWQNGVCYICLKPSKIRRLAVDHSHVTGEVRGLLCRRCNRELLGYFANDQVEMFQRAINYLTKTPVQRMADSETRDYE